MVGLRDLSTAEAAWVDFGVDDLTKYRIVQYLYQCLPGLRSLPTLDDDVEVRSLAAALGFHSLEQTTAAVEELSAAGIVRMSFAGDPRARCGRATDPQLRARVAELFALTGDSGEEADLIAHLSRRSLARARARASSQSRARAPLLGRRVAWAGGAPS